MKAIKNVIGAIILIVLITLLDREIGGKMSVNERTNTFFWAWGCVLALIVLALVNRCVSAQEVPVFYGALRPGIIGQTVCNKNNEVAIIINDGYNLDSTQLRRTIAHELHHAATIKTLGGCMKAAEVYMRDPMTQEIPAYCAELKERMVTSPTALSDFIRHIYGVYGIPKKMSIEQVARRVEELCTGRKNDSS